MIIKRAALRRKRARIWTEAHNTVKERHTYGLYHSLMKASMRRNPHTFFKCTRMYPAQFHHLVRLVRPLIQPLHTNFRDSISVGNERCVIVNHLYYLFFIIFSEERVAVTLRFLATGESFQSLALGFRMGKSTVAGIVKFTSKAIYHALKREYLVEPSSPQEWRKIAEDYYKLWNFPNCIGALDGKHVKIRAPLNGGSSHYNYKHFHSIVFLAMCDANYKFIATDIGAPGRLGDATVYHTSRLKKKLEENSLGLPPPEQLPHSQKVISKLLIWDF